MGGKSDAEDVPETSHDETFKTAKLADEKRPSFGPVEECGKHSGLEDSEFGFERYLWATIEVVFETPEAMGSLLETRGDF